MTEVKREPGATPILASAPCELGVRGWRRSGASPPPLGVLDIIKSAGIDPAETSVGEMAGSRYITMGEIRRSMGEIKWSRSGMLGRPDFDYSLLEGDLKADWDWGKLSYKVPEDFFLQHLNYPWRGSWLSNNPNLDIRYVLRYKQFKWSVDHALIWMRLSVDAIRELLDSGIDVAGGGAGISYNDSLTVEMIRAFPDVRWNMSYAALSPAITIEDIEKHPEMNWDYDGVMRRSDFGINRAIATDGFIYQEYVSMYAKPLDVIRNPDWGWNLCELSKNPYINHGVIEAVPGILAFPGNLVSNPGLRWRSSDRIVLENIYHYLCRPGMRAANVWHELQLIGRTSVDALLDTMKRAERWRVTPTLWKKAACLRIVWYLKPYTLLTRRRRVAILAEFGFLPGIARLICGLL